MGNSVSFQFMAIFGSWESEVGGDQILIEFGEHRRRRTRRATPPQTRAKAAHASTRGDTKGKCAHLVRELWAILTAYTQFLGHAAHVDDAY
jgi:hypothetical protein